MLNAGKLRHRIIIQKPIQSQDSDTGAVVVSWQNLAFVWANIAPLSAKEFIAAQAEESKVTARITIRYREDIDYSYRLYHAAKNTYYNIEGILSDADSGLEYLTIPVSEGLKYDGGDLSVPAILTTPAITGDAEIGETLTVSTGTWANEPDEYSYQWYVNDIAVSGATSNIWLVDAIINDIVTAGVIASNGSGEGEESITTGVLVTS